MAANQIGLNQIFPIYNENGTPFHDLVLRKGVVDSIVMSLGDKITGDVFYKDNTLQVTMKEYVLYNGIHFSLVNPPTIVREGMVADNGELKGMTKYSFEFYHPMCQLSNFPFTDVATKTGEEKYLSQNKTFSWIGKPQDYIDKLNKNLQGTVWYVRKSDRFPVEKDDELSDVQQFDDVSVAEAIKRGYEIWGTPYVVSQLPSTDPLYAQGKRFVVEYGLPSNEIYENESARQLDTPFVFHMGQGVGLKNNSRTPRNNKIVTRIAGYGSEDNVPYGYPQIVWTGNQDWDYTINNDPNNPLSYPIYKGIVGGQYVKLIKHPFTRTHLMPSIFTETVNKKVNPMATGYDPTIEIKDYYDAIATQEYPYTNEINPQAPSYESHEFADIKPELDADRNTGIVSAVPLNADLTPADHWDDSMDDDGNYLQSYFQITLPQLSFDLYACAAITQEMQINMRSGACIGCTFPVQVDWEDYKRNFYDEDGNFVPDGEQRDLTKYPKSNLGQISVVVQKDNSTFGTLMPNIYQQPKADDLFVFIGISLPLSYIANAEERLDDAMKTYMLENNVFYFDYPLKFDEHFLASNTQILEQIRPNSIIHFDYGGVEQQLFVKQLTVKYGNAPLPQYDITLTDNIEVVLNQIGQVADDVEKMSSLIAILRQSYSRNVWNELAKKLSKVDDDTAKGWITILKGVRTLSDFIELSEGGAFYTDENTLAHLTADVARIRERILGTLRIGDTTASVQTEPTLHVGGDARIDDSLEVHEDLNVTHDAVIGEILRALNHIYTNLLTSNNYTDDSAFGHGFSLSMKKNNEDRSYLVVDELFVRWKAIFNELEIRRISYTGGNRVSSHAASKIVKVKDIVKKLSYTVEGTVLTLSGQVNVIGQTLNIDGGVTVNGTTVTLTTNSVTYAKRCYAMKDDGTTATMNWWRVNDQARCQTFNIQEGVYQNVSNKSYWRRVLAVGSENIEIDGALSEKPYDYVDLSVADCMTGSDLPEAGDTIVQMGNRTDTSRQGFIVSEVAGESAPDIQIFRNVNSYTLEGKRKIILSPDDTHLRVNSLVIETEYDARRVPMERGDWDAIPEHKCYYYDLVQYNGSSWLCIYPESGIGGVKYTTEPPSESSIYWQIYAQKGADGKDGKDGKSFNILGSYDTEEELVEAHPTGQVGDAYIVAGYLYVWDDENNEWHNSGQIKGDTGRGISSVTISYGKSNSSTTIPSTWYSSVDAVGLQAGDYLFTRMVYNYTDGEPAQSEPVYSIGYIGRDGSSPVVGDIDNEVISVACDKDGKVLAEYNKTISVKIYNGSTPVTLKDNGLTVSSASGITIDQVSAANGTFRVHIPQNNTIAQANNFTVTATANIGGADVSRGLSFVVNGVRQGADGTPATIYELLTSLSSIKKDKDGTPDVNTITATKQKTVGNVTSETTDGTLKYKIDGGSEQTYSSAIQTSSISTGIEFIYYIGNVIVDRETIPVIMDGQDGKSVYIDSQSVTYSKQSQGNLDPTTLTYGSYPSSLGKGDWLYSKTTIVYKNSDGSTAGTTNSYTVSYIGTDGDNGVGISGFTEHYKASANSTGEALPSSEDWGTNPSPSDWDINKPYLWNYEKITKVDKDGNTTYERTTPSVVAIFTKGISSVVNHYVATSESSGVTKQNPSDGTWTTSVQNPTSTKRYLWNYETTEYSNGQSTETDPHIISVYGEKGDKGDKGDSVSVDEQNSKTEYVVSNQGTSAPTSGWSTTIPAVPQGQYLWTKVTTAFTDGNSTVSYGVSYRGTDGDDVQIDTSRTYVRYSTVKTASQPADSTFTLTTPPQLSEGDYLWSLSQTAYVGVSSVLKSYSVSRLGIDGDEGERGADGYTTHFAYATSADGSQGFSTTNFNGATYIGTYRDQNATDSTNYQDYTWTEWKGEKGEKGDDGTSVTIDTSNTFTKYQKGDSGTTIPTGTWQTTIPPAEQGKYLWTWVHTAYSDGSYTDVYTPTYQSNDGTDSLPLAYLNLSDSVVDIEVDENGKATKDFYEEITYTMGAYGKFLYIKSVSVSSSSHVSIPAYMISPLANGLITVNGTTATLTKGGVTVQGTTATLPYGYTAIPRIEIKAQEGDTINEGTVTVNGVAIDTDGNEYTAMSIFKVARQYRIEALQLVLSQDTMILKQNESGHKDIDLTDAYTDVALRIGGTDITSDLSIETEVSQFYDEEDEHYINSCNVSVVGNRVRITAIGSYSYIPSGSTDEKIVYCEKGYVDITATYRGEPYTKRFSFVCELLGTWFEKVENDTQKIVAQRISYVVNDGDPTKTIEQTKDTFTQMSSSVEQVSEWKEEKENVYDGYDQRITNTNTRVSDAERNISRVQRTVQNGNDNLVMNGAFISDTLNWSEWGEPSIREIVSVDGCKWMHIVTTSEKYQGYMQIHFSDFGITIKGGEKYTLSLRAFCASGTSKICVGFHWRSSAVSANILADWFPFDIDTEKKQYKVTFTVPETGTYEEQSYDIDHFRIMVGSNYEMQGVEGRNFYITDIKLEQGEIVTSWSDNVNDSYSQIKQTADALTVQINGKASHSEVTQTAEQISATITNKLGETGININGDTRSIRLQADTTTIDSDVIVGSLKTKPDANGFYTEINGGENRVAQLEGGVVKDVMRWGKYSIPNEYSGYISSQIFYINGVPKLVINAYGVFSLGGGQETYDSAYWSAIKYYHKETTQGVDTTGLMDALRWAETKGRTTGSENPVKATAEYYIFHCAKRTTGGVTTVIHPELEGLVYSEIGTIGTDMDITGGTLTNAGYYIEWDSDEYVGRKQVLSYYKQVFRVRASKVGSNNKIAYSGWIYYGYNESTPNIWELTTSSGAPIALDRQTFGAYLDQYHD